jgi:hypothetical protein
VVRAESELAQMALPLIWTWIDRTDAEALHGVDVERLAIRLPWLTTPCVGVSVRL